MARIQSLISLLLIASLFWGPISMASIAFADETEAPVGEQAAADTAAAETTSTDSSTTDTSTSENSSSANESSSSSTETDTTSASESQSENHDDLTIHAEGSGSAVTDGATSSAEEVIADLVSDFTNSSTTVSEGVVDTATSSTDTGFLTGGGSGTSSTQETNGGGGGVIMATGQAAEALDATTTHPTILSGQAIILANIINLLNTSFINSSGGILFSNFTEAAPTIDLRDLSLFSGMCGEAPCSGQEGIQLNLVDDAMIQNDLVLDAITGRNEASGGSTTSIQSGNAFAGLNLVNFANTTFVNSNYLIVTLNAFRGVNGDIVFPSLLDFFNGQSSVTALGDSSIVNNASVSNDVTASADAGSNTVEGADNSTIATGDANAHTNIFNQINSLLPDSRISILFRISGTWKGKMYGVPDNVSVIRAPDGSIFMFGASSTPSGLTPNTYLNSTSTAAIDNRVQVSALSGQNAIDNAQTALISSGNAFASANIVNIANQNIIGRNWILAIIDIFGDFNGDIAFGRPDLWVGDQVEAPGVVQNGSDLTYKITVINNGDAVASNATLTERPDWSHVEIIDSSVPYATSTAGALTWMLGDLPPKGAVEITYHARVKSTSPNDAIVNHTSVTEDETDNNMEDNSDSTTVRATVPSGGGGGGSGSCCSFSGASNGKKPPADALKVERVSNAMVASHAAPNVKETIIVRNTSDVAISGVIFRDMLRDSAGTGLHEEVWKLDKVAPKEEIMIEYDVVFDEAAPSGIYTLTTTLDGADLPSGIYANGSILYRANPELLAASVGTIPKVKIANRHVMAAPMLMEATSSPVALTAAVAAVDPGVSSSYSYIVLFILSLLCAYGAIRTLRTRREGTLVME